MISRYILIISLAASLFVPSSRCEPAAPEAVILRPADAVGDSRLIKAWGLSLDGLYALNGKARTRLLEELGANAFKLELHPEAWAEGDVPDEFFFPRLRDSIKRVPSRRSALCVLEIKSPPPAFKRWHASGSHWEMNPNFLLPAMRTRYVQFVASVLGRLRNEGATVDRLVLHYAADSILTDPGCAYTPEDWRGLMDIWKQNTQLKSVGVIGSSSLGLPRAVEFEQAAAPRADGSRVIGFGWKDGGGPGEIKSSVYSEVWMTGWSARDAENETEAVLQAVARIIGDIGGAGVTHWIYEDGYSLNYSVSALCFRDGQVTLLFSGLRTLWNAVPAGSEVVKLEMERSDAADGLSAVGFRTGELCRYLVLNSGKFPRRVIFPEKQNAILSAHLIAGKDNTNSGGNGSEFVISGRSAILIAEELR